MSNPVGWFEIYVDDMDRAKSFYEGVLGTTLQPLPTPEGDVSFMMAFPMAPEASGSSGALVKMGDDRPRGNGVLIYFSCEDCATEGSRVEANGGSIFKGKFSIGDYGFIVLATDTEGNMFGLHSMK
jgi:predicted enzyme related to lactoylglutathione lyase